MNRTALTEPRDVGLDEIIAGLSAKSGRLREVADRADEAIAALRKLQVAYVGAATPAAAASPAPARRAQALRPSAARVSPDSVDRHGHRVYGKARPRTARCQNERCGKEFETKGTGRVPHYCSDVCRTARGKRVRRAAAPAARAAAAPEPKTPIGAAVDDLLTREEPIPESGPGMRERVKRALSNHGPAKPTVLDRARERNDEAARRHGVGVRRTA